MTNGAREERWCRRQTTKRHVNVKYLETQKRNPASTDSQVIYHPNKAAKNNAFKDDFIAEETSFKTCNVINTDADAEHGTQTLIYSL